jgi:hypothetical protein
MLKSHALARRRSGLALLLALGLLGAGTVHAFRTPASADAQDMVMLKMSITATDTVDGAPRKQRASPKMLVALGQTASLRMGGKDGDAQALSIEMTPTQTRPGFYKVKTRLSRGNPLETVSETELSLTEGELTTFDSGTDSNGRSILVVLTAAAHKGPVKLQP